MQKQEPTEEEQTAKLAKDAFYKRTKTPKSQIIMLKILHVNRLDLLQRINKLCGLAYFVKPDAEKLNLDFDLIEIILSVSNSLINTKKQHRYFDGFKYDVYPVAWSFSLTPETYKRYISKWLETYEFYRAFVKFPSKDYWHSETWFTCPYCKKTILSIPQASKEKAVQKVKNQFKDSFQQIKDVLISEEEEKQRRKRFYGYRPPYWEATYIICPECKKKIRVTFEFYRGKYANRFDPIEDPEFETKELIIENKTYPDPVLKALQFNATADVLSLRGFNQLKAAFVRWCEPHVSRIEWEILKLVDEDDLKKYLEYEFKSRKEAEEEQ